MIPWIGVADLCTKLFLFTLYLLTRQMKIGMTVRYYPRNAPSYGYCGDTNDVYRVTFHNNIDDINCPVTPTCQESQHVNDYVKLKCFDTIVTDIENTMAYESGSKWLDVLNNNILTTDEFTIYAEYDTRIQCEQSSLSEVMSDFVVDGHSIPPKFLSIYKLTNANRACDYGETNYYGRWENSLNLYKCSDNSVDSKVASYDTLETCASAPYGRHFSPKTTYPYICRFNPFQCQTIEGEVYSDPHIRTFDKLRYQHNGVGKYIIYETQKGKFDKWEKQPSIRIVGDFHDTPAFRPANGSRPIELTGSLLRRYWIEIDGDAYFKFDWQIIGGDVRSFWRYKKDEEYKELVSDVKCKGNHIEIGDLENKDNYHFAYVKNSIDYITEPKLRFYIHLRDGTIISHVEGPLGIDLYVCPSYVAFNRTSGLLGTWDGNIENEFVDKNEKVIVNSIGELNWNEIFNWAKIWRIGDIDDFRRSILLNDSMGTVVTGNVEDLHSLINNSTFSNEVRNACNVISDNEYAEDCEFDILITGDFSFVDQVLSWKEIMEYDQSRINSLPFVLKITYANGYDFAGFSPINGLDSVPTFVVYYPTIIDLSSSSITYAGGTGTAKGTWKGYVIELCVFDRAPFNIGANYDISFEEIPKFLQDHSTDELVKYEEGNNERCIIAMDASDFTVDHMRIVGLITLEMGVQYWEPEEKMVLKLHNNVGSFKMEIKSSLEDHAYMNEIGTLMILGGLGGLTLCIIINVLFITSVMVLCKCFLKIKKDIELTNLKMKDVELKMKEKIKENRKSGKLNSKQKEKIVAETFKNENEIYEEIKNLKKKRTHVSLCCCCVSCVGVISSFIALPIVCIVSFALIVNAIVVFMVLPHTS